MNLILALGAMSLPLPASAALQALDTSSPSFLDPLLGFFQQDFSTSKRILFFLKVRAESARATLLSPKIPVPEKNRRIFIEVNRAHRVLQDSRRHLSEELYTTFKLRIDQARHRAAASDFWWKRKHQPARAQMHLNALQRELQDTLETIAWIEWATGGF